MNRREQHWADPIERPEPRGHWAPEACAWLIAAAAVALAAWRYAA